MNVKKTLFICLCAVLSLTVIISVYAQGTRSAEYDSEGKTSLGNVAVTGIDKEGVPGYIELNDGYGNIYYLWIGYNGKLLMASERIVGFGASPALVQWGGSCSGIVVGTQSGSDLNWD